MTTDTCPIFTAIIYHFNQLGYEGIINHYPALGPLNIAQRGEFTITTYQQHPLLNHCTIIYHNNSPIIGFICQSDYKPYNLANPNTINHIANDLEHHRKLRTQTTPLQRIAQKLKTLLPETP